ncbi:hypothetical protein Tsubulata_007100 [Turnera subulata]|uniref:PB1 domain-containing protein n=1 Tax=Turnera subulata TaxID=218843 RepID=A0A9Q0GKW9_9ROSI|nr:hypothetical protein Tsubulata_007100 [Turnera subulata]
MVSDSETKKSPVTVKFLCSYGGKILPRSVDGKLRYVGGLTRVLAVDRSISFAELMVKLGEFCGYSVELKCQLPKGDLETLISVKSDEELANLIEEYDRVAPGSKIRAVLTPPKSLKTVSPPPSAPASVDYTATRSPYDSPDYRRYRSNSPSFGCYGDSGRFRYDYSRRGLAQHQRTTTTLCWDPRCYGYCY